MSDYESTQDDERFEALCKSLRMSINAALSVGGPERHDGRAGRLGDTDIFRKTGIARSTLRAIRQGDANHAPNPDLRTLNRLANMMGVPLAFLLMAPEDWELLINAVSDLEYTGKSAGRVLGNKFGTHTAVRRILEDGGLFRIPRPSDASPDPRAQARLNKINEDRRRVSHVMGALMLRQPEFEKRHAQHVALVALAASITNQIKQRHT